MLLSFRDYSFESTKPTIGVKSKGNLNLLDEPLMMAFARKIVGDDAGAVEQAFA